MFLTRILRLGFSNDLGCIVGKEDGTVAVGFEVDANVKSGRGVMQVLDASRSHDYRKFQDFLDIFRRCTVGVGSLHQSNLELVTQTSLFCHLGEEDCTKCSDPITIEQTEDPIGVIEVIDDSVSVAIKRAASFVWAGFDAWRRFLLGLDIVRATLYRLAYRTACCGDPYIKV